MDIEFKPLSVSKIKLKPCPFCGSEKLQHMTIVVSNKKDICIRCRTCGGKMQIMEEFGENELIKRWNTRT